MKKLVLCLMFFYGVAYAGTSTGGVGNNNSVVNVTVSGISGGDVTASSVTTTLLGVNGIDVSDIGTSSVSWSTCINSLETSSKTWSKEINDLMTSSAGAKATLRLDNLEISSVTQNTRITNIESSSTTMNVALSSLQSLKATLASPTFTGEVGIPKISSGTAPSGLYKIGYDFVADQATVYISTSTEELGWVKVGGQ